MNIQNCFNQECKWNSELTIREFVVENFFEIPTYDDNISEEIGNILFSICDAITAGKTYEFNAENGLHYCLTLSTPVLRKVITWGSSIRGAWWDTVKLTQPCLWKGDNQLDEIILSPEEWVELLSQLKNLWEKRDAN